MLKTGRWRALRNIPVGWVMQSLHGTDRSERRFRILMELLLAGGVLAVGAQAMPLTPLRILLLLVLTHTLNWCLTGNFWVYLLDSFLWVRNPGIRGVLDYTRRVRSVYQHWQACEAILIYGSMCRGQFHGRSDLDLRIVRRTDNWRGWLALLIGWGLRAYAFVIAMPVDLQVVDSLAFLKDQMRADEIPIVVYRRPASDLKLAKGQPFGPIEARPELVLKVTRPTASKPEKPHERI